MARLGQTLPASVVEAVADRLAAGAAVDGLDGDHT